MSVVGFSRFVCVIFLSGLILTRLSTDSVAADQLPSFATLQRVVAQRLAARAPGDLISQGDVAPVFQDFERLGWAVADRKDINDKLLADSDPVVAALRSRRGVKFMRQVSGYRLIYDRLDRIARESGGTRLIQDLIKLPNAARYAKAKPPRGVPEMHEFLPKGQSGRTRKVTDYTKPTGKLYTADDLLKRLRKSYDRAVQAAKS